MDDADEFDDNGIGKVHKRKGTSLHESISNADSPSKISKISDSSLECVADDQGADNGLEDHINIEPTLNNSSCQWTHEEKLIIGGESKEFVFDFSSLKGKIMKPPSLSYRKNMEIVDIECELIDGTKRSKSFKFIDFDTTMNIIQSFVSHGAQEWIAQAADSKMPGKCESTIPKCESNEWSHVKKIKIGNLHKEYAFDFSPVKDMVQSVPSIINRRNKNRNTLDLECMLKNGQKVCKSFTHSVFTSTAEEIQKFITNKAPKWIEESMKTFELLSQGNDGEENAGEKKWIKCRQIKIGNEFKDFIADFTPLREFLTLAPRIYHRPKRRVLDLECTLKNDSKMTKSFKYRDFDTTTKEIQMFITNEGAAWASSGHRNRVLDFPTEGTVEGELDRSNTANAEFQELSETHYSPDPGYDDTYDAGGDKEQNQQYGEERNFYSVSAHSTFEGAFEDYIDQSSASGQGGSILLEEPHSSLFGGSNLDYDNFENETSFIGGQEFVDHSSLSSFGGHNSHEENFSGKWIEMKNFKIDGEYRETFLDFTSLRPYTDHAPCIILRPNRGVMDLQVRLIDGKTKTKSIEYDDFDTTIKELQTFISEKGAAWMKNELKIKKVKKKKAKNKLLKEFSEVQDEASTVEKTSMEDGQNNSSFDGSISKKRKRLSEAMHRSGKWIEKKTVKIGDESIEYEFDFSPFITQAKNSPWIYHMPRRGVLDLRVKFRNGKNRSKSFELRGLEETLADIQSFVTNKGEEWANGQKDDSKCVIDVKRSPSVSKQKEVDHSEGDTSREHILEESTTHQTSSSPVVIEPKEDFELDEDSKLGQEMDNSNNSETDVLPGAEEDSPLEEKPQFEVRQEVKENWIEKRYILVGMEYKECSFDFSPFAPYTNLVPCIFFRPKRQVFDLQVRLASGKTKTKSFEYSDFDSCVDLIQSFITNEGEEWINNKMKGFKITKKGYGNSHNSLYKDDHDEASRLKVENVALEKNSDVDNATSEEPLDLSNDIPSSDKWLDTKFVKIFDEGRDVVFDFSPFRTQAKLSPSIYFRPKRRIIDLAVKLHNGKTKTKSFDYSGFDKTIEDIKIFISQEGEDWISQQDSDTKSLYEDSQMCSKEEEKQADILDVTVKGKEENQSAHTDTEHTVQPDNNTDLESLMQRSTKNCASPEHTIDLTDDGDTFDSEMKSKKSTSINPTEKWNQDPGGQWILNKKIRFGNGYEQRVFDFTPLRAHAKHAPGIFYYENRAVIELVCRMNNGKRKSKSFKYTDFDSTLQDIQDFVYKEGESWLNNPNFYEDGGEKEEEEHVEKEIKTWHVTSDHFIMPN